MDEVQRYHQLRKMLDDEAEAERLQEAGVVMSPPPTSFSGAEGELREGGEETAGGEAEGDATPPASRSQIEEFKKEVRAWMDLDIVIKNLSGMLRDRRAHKKELTDRIVRFMNSHNIDDLDTREGSIRSRVSYVKPPLSQRMIRESLHSYFAHNEAVATQVLNSVFNRGRDRVERASLRLRPAKENKMLIGGPSRPA